MGAFTGNSTELYSCISLKRYLYLHENKCVHSEKPKWIGAGETVASVSHTEAGISKNYCATNLGSP